MEWRRGRIPLIELYGLWEWLPSTSATKTAMAGVVDDRRWGDTEWLLAAQVTHLRTLLQVAWAGFRLPGDTPTFEPVRAPRTAADVAADRKKAREKAEADRLQAARMAYLRTLRPPPR
ncbi:hypothetical protein [Actinomadura violacea]|uniref:Uncharacterized protein n=1 Tax=Actinomadura violacea TaxID=2819934 RepID=A0ABS3RSS8_9ACTN|nr:hypothetical protein [Actinomadura violacea]MBO2459821.1 hypothetical protein [Actinomadura violacea]